MAHIEAAAWHGSKRKAAKLDGVAEEDVPFVENHEVVQAYYEPWSYLQFIVRYVWTDVGIGKKAICINK